jgi:hypothetical protein
MAGAVMAANAIVYRLVGLFLRSHRIGGASD